MKRLFACALCALTATFAHAQNVTQRATQQPATGQAQQQQAGQQPGQVGGQQTRQAGGQQTGQFGRQQAGQRMQSGATFTDAQIAAFLNGGNEAEVNVAKLAEKQAKSDDVKKMAQEMVTAHTKLWQHLNQIAMQGGFGEQANGQQAQQQFEQGRGLNFLAIEQQIARQCETSILRDLKDKQGEHFDKAYIGWNIGAHIHMLDALKVVRSHASPQLQQTLAQAEQETQQHLDHFKKLMHQVDSNTSKAP